MSIELTNGDVLPDIPQNIIKNYPYIMIISIVTDMGFKYTLTGYDGPYYYVDGETKKKVEEAYYGEGYGASSNDLFIAYGNNIVSAICGAYSLSGLNSWSDIHESTTPGNTNLGLRPDDELVACNFDVYHVGTYGPKPWNFTPGTTVYFRANLDGLGNVLTNPTRVAIGINLAEKFAVQIKRLTGTTEQMNAVQMRDLLKTVKSAGVQEEDTSEIELDEDCASIAYELFNDIVEEVQRLSGSTEQMNAITAYRKLTGVRKE